MGSRKVRPLLFIAAGIVIAALIGFAVWYAGSPSMSDGTSTNQSEALPSSNSSRETTSTAQQLERTTAPTTTEDASAPAPFVEPDQDDPFLPPNARLAAPDSIERETNVYRPTNIVPEGADQLSGDSSDQGSSRPDTLASASGPLTPSEDDQVFPNQFETPEPGQPSSPAESPVPTEPGSSVDPNQTVVPTQPLESGAGAPAPEQVPGESTISQEMAPNATPAPSTPPSSPAESGQQAPSQQEPTVVPQPERPTQDPAPTTQQQQQQQVPQSQDPSSNNGTPLWWQQLQGQFIR
ncbi:hypothetical protein [Corynebacterium lubricantis]|uniref:hypothetical protein n=1 Tax=Corynebacterium lubricantis TaxID=541095 RepID=UPI0003A21FDC|nr:hypothetical protein [Corynebacterium lubricantis]